MMVSRVLVGYDLKLLPHTKELMVLSVTKGNGKYTYRDRD
jgi:hypothetical protein